MRSSTRGGSDSSGMALLALLGRGAVEVGRGQEAKVTAHNRRKPVSADSYLWSPLASPLFYHFHATARNRKPNLARRLSVQHNVRTFSGGADAAPCATRVQGSR